MRLISPVQGLMRKLEEGKEIRHSDLQRALPRRLRPRLASFASELGMLDLAYIVSVTSFYGNMEKAFYWVLSAPRRAERHGKSLSYKEFYERQREAYERRCFYGVPHQLRFLEAALDFSPDRKACSGKTSAGLGNPSPWRENAVRALEDAPRAIEDVNHVWDR